MNQGQTITREEILARLNDPSLLLVNVMPKEAFEDGHIPRSINLPLSEIETKARQLFPDVAGARLSSTVMVPPNLWANRRSVCSRAWLQKYPLLRWRNGRLGGKGRPVEKIDSPVATGVPSGAIIQPNFDGRQVRRNA